jgi:SAM-dependent methyltransferase
LLLAGLQPPRSQRPVTRAIEAPPSRNGLKGGVSGDGSVFNHLAKQYDRDRPTYPDALIDRACEVAGLAPGARVLEIGCGTGQLTQSLHARGLRVVAVEPGDRLISGARDQLRGSGEVQFVNARLEDATLPSAHYQAVFSAAAIHWVDPDVGWRMIADTLDHGGTLALLSYFGMEDPRSAEDQRALRAVLAKIAPDVAAEWPTYRDFDTTLAGAAERRDNISEVWAWLGSYQVARPYVRNLFEAAQLAAIPVFVEHTADALSGLMGTMSFWSHLSSGQREALAAEHRVLHQRLGRPIRSTTVACLVTARRRARA